MNADNSREYAEGNQGGCTIKDAHDELRSGTVDVGGEETTTEDLMKPQSAEPEAYDG